MVEWVIHGPEPGVNTVDQPLNASRGFLFSNNPFSTFFFQGIAAQNRLYLFLGFAATTSERAHRERREEGRSEEDSNIKEGDAPTVIILSFTAIIVTQLITVADIWSSLEHDGRPRLWPARNKQENQWCRQAKASFQ